MTELDLFSWKPPAGPVAPSDVKTTEVAGPGETLVFPLYRRADLVRRHGARLLDFDLRGQAIFLKREFDRQRRVLRKKNIPEVVVDRELRSLRRAILAEANRLLFPPSGRVAP